MSTEKPLELVADPHPMEEYFNRAIGHEPSLLVMDATGAMPAAFDRSHRRDRAEIERPSPIEALRAARPSRELLALLARESMRLGAEGNTDDAAALIILGLCVREVLT